MDWFQVVNNIMDISVSLKKQEKMKNLVMAKERQGLAIVLTFPT